MATSLGSSFSFRMCAAIASNGGRYEETRVSIFTDAVVRTAWRDRGPWILFSGITAGPSRVLLPRHLGGLHARCSAVRNFGDRSDQQVSGSCLCQPGGAVAPLSEASSSLSTFALHRRAGDRPPAGLCVSWMWTVSSSRRDAALSVCFR